MGVVGDIDVNVYIWRVWDVVGFVWCGLLRVEWVDLVLVVVVMVSV